MGLPVGLVACFLSAYLHTQNRQPKHNRQRPAEHAHCHPPHQTQDASRADLTVCSWIEAPPVQEDWDLSIMGVGMSVF